MGQKKAFNMTPSDFRFGPASGHGKCHSQRPSISGLVRGAYSVSGGFMSTRDLRCAQDEDDLRACAQETRSQHPRQMPVKWETSGRPRRRDGVLLLGSTACVLTMRDEPPREDVGSMGRTGATW